jgi:cobaltochelatase CobN
MHLLQAKAGAVSDGSEAIDLGQTPAEIVYLSAADTELASLANAVEHLGDESPELRLANLMQLGHPMSVDLYVDDIIAHAKLVIVRLLGGIGYWNYGVEQVIATARAHNIPVALLPGDDQPDAELTSRSTVPAQAYHRLWQYLVHGGPDNSRNLLSYATTLLGRDAPWLEPAPLAKAGLYWPGDTVLALTDLRAHWQADAPVAALVFYRALVQAGNIAPIDALVEQLRVLGINALPIFCSSLKDPVSAGLTAQLLGDADADIILNATGFAVATPGVARASSPFDAVATPVLQVIFSGGNADAWADDSQGLGARDIAMNVALPEVDGRILSRAVSFKSEARYDERTQASLVTYAPVTDRVEFVARLASAWIKLRRTTAKDRRIAIVLANYPNRDGRLGNGVGLDTPAGTVELLRAMREAGYDVEDIPATGNALIDRMREGPTNAARDGREIKIRISEADYEKYFSNLPPNLQTEVTERWGGPDQDPFYVEESFALPAFYCGGTIIGLQPARGYNIDPSKTYHDPALVPPHGYLAFYAWLQSHADAVIHMGKHGNLEWLPGKALALSSSCYPEAALGPMPHIYPFIVNDPGEGTQAKRRSQAVIIDHLTPPLTRAETYGPLSDLERLVDEYYEASGVDPRRLAVLRDQIVALSGQIGLDADCGIVQTDDADSALEKLDNYLCELKELQIRDGLHIFGISPDGELLDDLLVALTRIPRGKDSGASASLLRALARDFSLDFDPLDCHFGTAWDGARPEALTGPDNWRTYGDTVERMELLARDLVNGRRKAAPEWAHTNEVLTEIQTTLRPAVEACGDSEINGVLTALAGQFVEPGPSGAPTRGRPEVLPTGRNFYSVDTRTVPTPAAWQLGWKSAGLMLQRYRQEHGEWPKRMALSAWGTSNMRTGGDDIAQALALMGAKPTWEPASRKVTGYEILPISLLDRPRVDVTLRISGFFRDAFPTQIDLFDSAVRAVAELDESARDNPLAEAVRTESARLEAEGANPAQALQQAGYRIFGSKPGAYGAGLQALIDERGWHDDADLANAWLTWGSYAYGGGAQGAAAGDELRARLSKVQAIAHNQDNREHDLLDSDDYYQFEGGLAATVRHLSGEQPEIYHNDHSRPERPRIKRLEEEIAQVVRARVVNPKWIRGVMRHGYKGAFEIAATVDYLFAFAATARVVADHHFDAVYDAFIGDMEVRDFIETNNDAALAEIAARLLEAQTRGLWRARSNSAHQVLERLSGQIAGAETGAASDSA